MSALDDLLSDIRHDSGCNADIAETFDCRCRRDARVNEARMDLAALRAKVAELERAKDGAYRERDALVCALSKLFPSWLGRHPADQEWDDDWRWIVFVSLPTGQASWHIHDSELEMFAHVPRQGAPTWDGHTTKQKYERLAALPSVNEYHTLGFPDAELSARVRCQLAAARAEMLTEPNP